MENKDWIKEGLRGLEFAALGEKLFGRQISNPIYIDPELFWKLVGEQEQDNLENLYSGSE